ncbi:2-acylglycerol O-acyltransferase 3-like, partial [Terrapene carolina triunguis]|uniref:2-acylglycerol O-acyltransferase 3-like n=1 Tax=Terrapene triunguis TaxID=2587831 RepID=UPI0011568354
HLGLATDRCVIDPFVLPNLPSLRWTPQCGADPQLCPPPTGAFFTSLLFYLLFTRLWAVSVLYFVWWVLDRDTPERGGRRSDWMRRWRVWQHLTDYYPVKLVKTAALPPDRSYVLGSHPHGIMCAGAAAAFCTEGPGFSQLFPGLRPSLALLAGLFRLPLYREYMMGF